jgi:hypothetical protein
LSIPHADILDRDASGRALLSSNEFSSSSQFSRMREGPKMAKVITVRIFSPDSPGAVSGHGMRGNDTQAKPRRKGLDADPGQVGGRTY